MSTIIIESLFSLLTSILLFNRLFLGHLVQRFFSNVVSAVLIFLHINSSAGLTPVVAQGVDL